MSANVETMFYTREKPWHGLGVRVNEAPTSKEALILAGLDWNVTQRPVLTDSGILIDGYKANIRDTDEKILGVVTDRYTVVQNRDAFAFTDELLGEGVCYETAGSLQEGKRTWMLARMPETMEIVGEKICPYLVIMNSHDGTGAIRVAITPIRVVCQNTLNLALLTAKRSWSTIHAGDMTSRMDRAKNTLFMAESYMTQLGTEIEHLNQIKLSDQKVFSLINELFVLEDTASDAQKKNVLKLIEDIKIRYFEAPDLKHVEKNAYRFVNAVSDFATHGKPLRETVNYKENLFARTIQGNTFIDKAYELVRAIA